MRKLSTTDHQEDREEGSEATITVEVEEGDTINKGVDIIVAEETASTETATTTGEETTETTAKVATTETETKVVEEVGTEIRDKERDPLIAQAHHPQGGNSRDSETSNKIEDQE